MSNRKTLITLSITLFSFTVFADCKTDLHQANHLLSQGAEINDALKTQLQSCIKSLNDCDQYSYRDNCQHIYAKINTASLPKHSPQIQQTSAHIPPAPVSQPVTPVNNVQPTLPPQNDTLSTNGTTVTPAPTPAAPTKQHDSGINWF